MKTFITQSLMNDLIQDINSKQDAIISHKLSKNKIKNDYEKTKSDLQRQAKIQKKSIIRSQIDQIKNSLKKKKKSSNAIKSANMSIERHNVKQVRFNV